MQDFVGDKVNRSKKHARSVDQKFFGTFRDLPIVSRSLDLMLLKTAYG